MSCSKFSSHFCLHFFFETQIFKTFTIQPPIFMIATCFQHEKGIYMKVRHSQLHRTQNGELLKVLTLIRPGFLVGL